MTMPALSYPSDDKSHRVLAEDLTVEWTCGGTTYRVTVPEGFRYRPGVGLRLGSLGLLDLFAPTYALETASAVHDWLYRNRGKIGGRGLEFKIGGDWYWTDEHLTRWEADAALYADDGDPAWVQHVAWALVRLFGWTVW